jgi:hypothetical protein
MSGKFLSFGFIISILFLTFIHISIAADIAPSSIAGKWQFNETISPIPSSGCDVSEYTVTYEAEITEDKGQIDIDVPLRYFPLDQVTVGSGTIIGMIEGYEINLNGSTLMSKNGIHEGDEGTLNIVNGSGNLSNDCNSLELREIYYMSDRVRFCNIDTHISAVKLDNFGCVYPDTTPPITTASASDDAGTAYTFGTPKKSAYISVALRCTDGNGTGCGSTKYCVDLNNQCTPSQVYSNQIQTNTQGISYIRYRSTDKSGNSEELKSQIVFIDNTLPTIEVIEPAPGSQLSNKTIEVELTVSDASLNHTIIEVLKGDEVVASTTSEEKGTFTVNLTVPADGTYKIFATAYDNALNNKSVNIANVEVKTPCGEVGRTCVFGTDCCSGACSDGKCIAAIIRPTEQPVVQDNTMLFVGIIVSILIVVGIVAYLLMIRKKPPKPAAQPAQQVPPKQAP